MDTKRLHSIGLGTVVTLTGWTRTNRSDPSFEIAAGQQLDHILNHVPRNGNGAISHREDQVQLWADFVYMVPPFIAYFGALETGDAKLWLLREGYNQCKEYREVLRDNSGLWQHIVLGTGLQDTTHWGTGKYNSCFTLKPFSHDVAFCAFYRKRLGGRWNAQSVGDY